MARVGVGVVLIVSCSFLLMSVHSNSTDDSNLLIHKYNCKPGDFYNLKDDVCTRCTNCTRERLKLETPCSLHSDALCGDCENGYEKQQQGESITCIYSADDNDGMAYPDNDSDLALYSTPSRPSNYANVTQTPPERIDADSDVVKESNNDITFSIMIFVVVIAVILSVPTIVLVVCCLRHRLRTVTKDIQTIPVRPTTNSTATMTGEDNRENDPLIKVIIEPPMDPHANALSSPAGQCIPRETSSNIDANTSDANTSVAAYFQAKGINWADLKDMDSSSNSNLPITSIEARDLSATQ